MIARRMEETMTAKNGFTFQGVGGVEYNLVDNLEYKIKTGKTSVIGTIADVCLIGGQMKVKMATVLKAGWLQPIAESDMTIRCDEITDITRMISKYEKTTRYKETISANYSGELFSFGFEHWKNPNDIFWVPIRPGEFIGMVIPLSSDPNKDQTIYGEVVDIVDDMVEFRRYKSNRGKRSVKTEKYDCNTITKLQKYELKIEPYVEKVAQSEDTAAV